MKISYRNASTGQWGLFAERGEYDAVPTVDTLLMDTSPQHLNPERRALAAYLAFGGWTSGALELDEKCGPAVADVIAADSSPVRIQTTPLEYYPKPLPIGRSVLALGTGLRSLHTETGTALAILPSDTFNGSLSTHRGVAVASNAFVFGRRDEIPVEQYLAVAVLFAEDLDADSVALPADWVEPTDLKRLRLLLSSVRLGLSVRN